MRTSSRLVAVLLLAMLGGGLALLGDSPADAQLEGTETRTVALAEGWNLAGWTGPEMPFAEAIADILEATQAAAAFDAVPQTFRTWNATAPPFLNTLDTLQRGEALWVQVTAPIDWVQPVVADPGPLALRSGFNLVTWAGLSSLPPATALAALAADLSAAFAFDKPSETFASFGPSRPAFLNDLAPLRYGDGFWLLMDAPADWTQPPASPPAEVTSADSSATLDIPRGALPAGIAVANIQITDTTADGTARVEGGDLLRSYQLEPSGAVFASPLTFRAEVDVASGSAVIAYLVDEEGSVILADIEITGREGGLGTTIRAPLPHFSRFYFAVAPGLVEVANVDEGEVQIGEALTTPLLATLQNPIDRVVSLFTQDESGEFILVRTARIRVEVGVRWSITRHFTILEGPLSGNEVADREVAGTGPLTIPASDFVCESAGSFTVLLTGNALLPTVGTRVVDVFVDAVVRGTCVAPRIKAALSPPITTYRVGLSGLGFVFAWSGTDCGSTRGAATNTMIWNHGGADCSHVGVAHPTTVITLRITIGDIELRCTYTSARTGIGPPCEPVE